MWRRIVARGKKILGPPWEFLRRHESAVQWVLIVVMIALLTRETIDTRHQSNVNHVLIGRLDARQSHLCIPLKDGRPITHPLGLGVVEIEIVDCPIPVKHQ